MRQEFRDPVVRAAFARRLRALRHAHGARLGETEYSQAAFARALGLRPETYRRYERGNAEPSLGALAKVRQRTGVSLCMLVAGEIPGSGSMVPVEGIGSIDEMQLGARMMMAREVLLPLAQAARVLGVTEAMLAGWEAGADRPPEGKMLEFAHRFGVGLDFLYRGIATGIADGMWSLLIEAHPELAGISAPSAPAPVSPRPDKNTATDAGKPVRRAKRPA